jgi:hypothetical protein
MANVKSTPQCRKCSDSPMDFRGTAAIMPYMNNVGLPPVADSGFAVRVFSCPKCNVVELIAGVKD